MSNKCIIGHLLVCLFILLSTLSFGQKVINTTGTTIGNADFTFEYSVGEVAIITYSNPENALTQGLLQPNIKFLNPTCDIINNAFVSFENPTRDKIRIVGRYDWITEYQIYAADGKLVRLARFQNNHIDMIGLPAAVYFIRLLPGCDSGYKTLKVVKQ